MFRRAEVGLCNTRVPATKTKTAAAPRRRLQVCLQAGRSMRERKSRRNRGAGNEHTQHPETACPASLTLSWHSPGLPRSLPRPQRRWENDFRPRMSPRGALAASRRGIEASGSIPHAEWAKITKIRNFRKLLAPRV